MGLLNIAKKSIYLQACLSPRGGYPKIKRKNTILEPICMAFFEIMSANEFPTKGIAKHYCCASQSHEISAS